MDVDVRKVPEANRYEARVGDAVAGFAEYRTEDGVVVLTHTRVDPRFEGQGIGGRLARALLDDLRAAGRPVLPRCSFMRAWIERHPGYADLVQPPPPDAAG